MPNRISSWYEGAVIHIHNVGRNQREIIEVYGHEVLPAFRSGATAAASRNTGEREGQARIS
ncbi:MULTISPECIES: hypothetical protein [unclassified Rhizobium]|uniref:hypothetical protein n=1 Tax=unclassified Rhizobium TaxID=2613769 RepID=UPI001C838942|nr:MULTISPECIES: hypothetical protein [unclassified Rhizobium]MBX5219329.1 hypothetical protein [Rhizobium sp. NLR8a]MBX5229516.1 hypothetical protein [Rhizobium sp. NLR9b]MBX5241308.1 hypothetical protein [Rhizobium sp. NLR22b]MBX5290323.1 hypothetical protein [Rhizobium sp. NLR10b]